MDRYATVETLDRFATLETEGRSRGAKTLDSSLRWNDDPTKCGLRNAEGQKAEVRKQKALY